jgi:hypothetical protein
MEGIFSLALLLVFGLPFALLKLALKLLMLPLGLLVPQLLQFLSGKSNPREAALSEASRGAAMIVLPVVVLLRRWRGFAVSVAMGGAGADALRRFLALQRRKIRSRLA